MSSRLCSLHLPHTLASQAVVDNSEDLDVVLVAFQQRECNALMRAAGVDH